jgi:hypothetical protein
MLDVPKPEFADTFLKFFQFLRISPSLTLKFLLLRLEQRFSSASLESNQVLINKLFPADSVHIRDTDIEDFFTIFVSKRHVFPRALGLTPLPQVRAPNISKLGTNRDEYIDTAQLTGSASSQKNLDRVFIVVVPCLAAEPHVLGES